MPVRTLRWLFPPDADHWIGTYESIEVARVWSSGLNGNSIEQWNWTVHPFALNGTVPGTGDDDRDLRMAQNAANGAFFETREQL